jgi:hypothetical protein
VGWACLIFMELRRVMLVCYNFVFLSRNFVFLLASFSFHLPLSSKRSHPVLTPPFLSFENSTGLDDPPALKHRSYAFGVTTSTIGVGIGTRPRRSASLSDAGGEYLSFSLSCREFFVVGIVDLEVMGICTLRVLCLYFYFIIVLFRFLFYFYVRPLFSHPLMNFSFT